MGFFERLFGEEPGFFDTLFNYENPGQYGEYATHFALTNDNIDGYYKVLSNVYLPTRNSTTEIDIILIHRIGIYIFESKNYSGWIFGDEVHQKWTQCLPNKERHSFYNPILQNEIHRNVLAKYLNLPASKISSYIIFSNRCELKKVPEDCDSYCIMKREDMLDKLRYDIYHKEEIYSANEVDSFANRLAPCCNLSEAQKKKHVEHIKTTYSENSTICPYCKNKLVLRSGSYGKFYGCSSFPKCRYTRNA